LSTGILHPRPAIAASFVAKGYRVSREPIRVTTRAAIAVSTVRSITLPKLYISDTLLERLAQNLEDMAAELGPCIQEAHAVVGQRHVARHRHGAPTDQPRLRRTVDVAGCRWRSDGKAGPYLVSLV
jgi:hypothetical protein